ncbi:hypothetical protein J437_LFUL018162 [Ladona fulva]|uniref:Uncharacterized protein n=1 Tax=Ladona fulva TaxID=123851 RepID=A0A8K0KP91_LADFU|nr:hypothetical protein J437_LFUL018162 [Ladona fulva]
MVARTVSISLRRAINEQDVVRLALWLANKQVAPVFLDVTTLGVEQPLLHARLALKLPKLSLYHAPVDHQQVQIEADEGTLNDIKKARNPKPFLRYIKCSIEVFNMPGWYKGVIINKIRITVQAILSPKLCASYQHLQEFISIKHQFRLDWVRPGNLLHLMRRLWKSPKNVSYEFVRMPRATIDLLRWKATELMDVSLVHRKVYGMENLTYNLHYLLHVSDDCHMFGPLDRFSAFELENVLQKIKKLVQKPNQVLPQIVRRLHEQSLANFVDIQSDDLENLIKSIVLLQFPLTYNQLDRMGSPRTPISSFLGTAALESLWAENAELRRLVADLCSRVERLEASSPCFKSEGSSSKACCAKLAAWGNPSAEAGLAIEDAPKVSSPARWLKAKKPDEWKVVSIRGGFCRNRELRRPQAILSVSNCYSVLPEGDPEDNAPAAISVFVFSVTHPFFVAFMASKKFSSSCFPHSSQSSPHISSSDEEEPNVALTQPSAPENWLHYLPKQGASGKKCDLGGGAPLSKEQFDSS